MLCPRRLCSEPPLCHHAVLSRDGQCSTPGLCPPCLESGPCPLGRSVRTLGPGGRGGYLHQYLPRSGQLGRLPPFPLLRTGLAELPFQTDRYLTSLVRVSDCVVQQIANQLVEFYPVTNDVHALFGFYLQAEPLLR